MFSAARAIVNQLINNINKPEVLLFENKPPTLTELVDQSKEQWHQARAYFENVNDPELVDYAINNLEAAEKRYNYLLKQLREQ